MGEGEKNRHSGHHAKGVMSRNPVVRNGSCKGGESTNAEDVLRQAQGRQGARW